MKNQELQTLPATQKDKGFLARTLEKVNTKTTAMAVTGIMALGASNSAFALDASAIVSEINDLKTPLTSIGVATIGVVLIAFGIAKAKGMIK